MKGTTLIYDLLLTSGSQFFLLTLPHDFTAEKLRYLEFETKHGHYLAKRNKTTGKTKKRRPEDRLMHLASHRTAFTSPKVPVC
ncbi:hypothetical protein H5410_061485 [Solanum commersonii]|uniref:Uncharacterized protein n=1 Tax=Solanum commersonii TaxID=4109 RepID=A0A9J5W8R9_SOLCO|nr:hypothetical protein H5410_061485 [Solanum commersonii]